MPAIQIDQLRIQSANLAGRFGSPESFAASFQEILESGTDLTFKPSAAQATTTRLKTYRIPSPILRQIERDLTQQMLVFPQSAFLALVKELRSRNILEYQLLAVFILGNTPLTPLEPVRDALFDWLAENQDLTINEALLTTGLSRLRCEHPDLWLNRVKTWLEDPSIKRVEAGLHALQPCLEDRTFENLPAVIQLLTPLLIKDHPEIEPELLTSVRTLIKRSPTETAFLAHQILSQPENEKSTALRIFRKLISEFPREIQISLRGLIFPKLEKR